MHAGPEGEEDSIVSGGSDLLMADPVNFSFSSGVFTNSIIQKGCHPATKEALSGHHQQPEPSAQIQFLFNSTLFM